MIRVECDTTEDFFQAMASHACIQSINAFVDDESYPIEKMYEMVDKAGPLVYKCNGCGQTFSVSLDAMSPENYPGRKGDYFRQDLESDCEISRWPLLSGISATISTFYRRYTMFEQLMSMFAFLIGNVECQGCPVREGCHRDKEKGECRERLIAVAHEAGEDKNGE